MLFSHTAEEERPDAEEHQDRQHPGQNIAEQIFAGGAGVRDAGLIQLGGNGGVDAGRGEIFLAAIRRLELTLDLLRANNDLLDFLVFQKFLELAVLIVSTCE